MMVVNFNCGIKSDLVAIISILVENGVMGWDEGRVE